MEWLLTFDAMFRHRGSKRTYKHNLRLAALLSFVAGVVNVAGLLSVHRLTTNVTGHFAFLAEEFSMENFAQGMVYFLFLIAFLLGSFFSNFLVEIMLRRNVRYMHTVPVGIEILLIGMVALLHPELLGQYPNLIAMVLLFAMGLQNALVTYLSNNVVRTTHLTGLFTDLGIELSQLFFYRKERAQFKLKTSIRLRLIIISGFFLGGTLGGVFYLLIGNRVFLLAVLTLVIALVYDSLRLRMIHLRRKLS